MGKLPLSFYRTNDVWQIAKSLIGKHLCTRLEGVQTSGIITETEAYAGVQDKGSHAYGNCRTERTEVMYANGGISYVYFTYGMHYLFNVVTSTENIPHAILIRGSIPEDGIEMQLKRRKIVQPLRVLTNGPAKVCQALGITKKLNGLSLNSETVWIEDRKNHVNEDDIYSGPRVGIGYAEEDAALPYRFILKHPDYIPVKHR